MKNHDRAVIIGETTFGKGSVQLVFNDLPDKAALKLTIAQYLTEPGDVSIQGVGVTPDIELDPMTVDPQEMDLTVDTTRLIKERDLVAQPLERARARRGSTPLETVRYDLPQKERQRPARARRATPTTTSQMDFPIRFGRDLVAHVAAGQAARPGPRGQVVHRATRAPRSSRRWPPSCKAMQRRLERRAGRTCVRRRTPRRCRGAERRREDRDRSSGQRSARAGEPMHAQAARVTNQGHGDALPARPP